MLHFPFRLVILVGSWLLFSALANANTINILNNSPTVLLFELDWTQTAPGIICAESVCAEYGGGGLRVLAEFPWDPGADKFIVRFQGPLVPLLFGYVSDFDGQAFYIAPDLHSGVFRYSVTPEGGGGIVLMALAVGGVFWGRRWWVCAGR